MFPKTQFKTTITVYSYYIDPLTDTRTYIRTLIPRVFWNTNSEAVRQRGGTAEKSQVTLHIPYNGRYLSQRDFAQLPINELDEHWTIGVGADQESSCILPMNCPFEFGWAKGDDFIRKYMRQFESEYRDFIHHAGNVDEYLYGSKSMWRIVVSC